MEAVLSARREARLLKMCKCNNCKYFFVDNSVGYFECTKSDFMSDSEYEDVIENENYENCKYFEEYIFF